MPAVFLALILAIGAALTALTAWLIMLLVGMAHHNVTDAAVPALGFEACFYIALIFAVLGGTTGAASKAGS